MTAADTVKKMVAAVLGEPARPRRKWRAKRSRHQAGPGAVRIDANRPIFEQVRQVLR